jgi:hypothetical protein
MKTVGYLEANRAVQHGLQSSQLSAHGITALVEVQRVQLYHYLNAKDLLRQHL